MKRIDKAEILATLEVLTRGMTAEEREAVVREALEEFLRTPPPTSPTVMLSGFYKNVRGGPTIQMLEAALEKFLGVKHVVTCSNGTAALHLALMAAGVRRGMKVAVPPLTFSATADACLMIGAEPVFVDVDRETYNMSPQDFAKVAERVDVAIPVHLLGVPCEMSPILEVAEKFNIVVIEDNAQALGALYKNKATGGWSQLSTLSFQETKVMTSGGEGGAVCTDSDEYADRLIALRNHGQQYPTKGPGTEANYACWNYRMTEIQAAIGLAQLSKLPAWNEAQRVNREYLVSALAEAGFEFDFQKAPRDSYATHYILGSTTNMHTRQTCLNKLKNAGWSEPVPGGTITAGYTRTIMDLPLLKPYRRSCPVSDWLVEHYVWWDIHRWLTLEEFKPRVEEILRIVKG